MTAKTKDTLRNSPAMMAVFNAIQLNITTGGMLGSQYPVAIREFDTDTRLSWLTGAVGDIAKTMTGGHRDRLLHIASILFVWLEMLGPDRLQVVEAVAAERQRQRQLFHEKQISFRVDSRVVCPARKLRVLVEELGEVAHAIDQLEQVNTRARRQHLITELVQTAAVTVAWLESLEGK